MKKRTENALKKHRGRWPLLASCLTVFISSFCIMSLELVAARLIARHLGSSLYTWTAVIGIVLAGITLGNYLGGRIADRYNARKAIAVLFLIASMTCVLTVVANNLVGEWKLLWRLSWPVRIFTHVSLVFLLPSTLLGTISPVVAKMALDLGLATGRTVGDIYAWGAAGSIAGTFTAGYLLIATMGTIAIIWTVAGVLLLIGITYWTRYWIFYAWMLLLAAAFMIGTASWSWAGQTGAALALREKPNPKIIYEDESQYCYISVQKGRADAEGIRNFIQDQLLHSCINMDDFFDLQYSYMQIFAAITHRQSAGKQKLRVMVIGGGGYVLPRYIEKVWPGSHIEVVEIDPGVTQAAIQAFGLEKNTSIKTIQMDGRNYIDELFEKQNRQGDGIRYDFIYEDAVNNYSVPFQLTTKQFNDKIAELLSDDGLYLTDLIEVYDSGLFLGSYVNTLEQTFPYVYVLSTAEELLAERNTFIVVAAKRDIDLDNLAADYKQKYIDIWKLSDSQVADIKAKAGEMILTDDYAPVENLLAPVARRDATNSLGKEYIKLAARLIEQGRFHEIMEQCEPALCNQPIAAAAYAKIGTMLNSQGQTQMAINVFHKALNTAERVGFEEVLCSIYSNLGGIMKRTGQKRQAKEYFDKAIEAYRRRLELYPDSATIRFRLGHTLMLNEYFRQASEVLAEAAELNPYDINTHAMWAQTLEKQGRFDEAIAVSRQILQNTPRPGNAKSISVIEKYIEHLKTKKKTD